MCTGRVDLSFPLRAFLDGADGVFVGGCWPGECHYLTEGNYDALGNVHLLRKLMKRIGLDARRLRIEWMASSQGSRFAEVMDDFAREVGSLGALGALGAAEGIDAASLRTKLESLSRLVPQFKLLIRERLAVRVKSEKAYEDLYASPKVDEWVDELLADPLCAEDGLCAYHVDPEACVGCQICQKKCPSHAIEGASKVVHVIDQATCTHCGTCYYACPPRIHAVKRVARDEVPAAIPPEKRVLAKGSRSPA